MSIKKAAPAYKRDREKLSRDKLNHLVFGHTFFDDSNPFKSEEKRKAAYFKNKSLVFSFQGVPRGNFKPSFGWGSRPSGWWSYERPPDQRKQIAGDPIEAVGTKVTFGRPSLWKKYVPGVEFESQHDYLVRHGLIGEEEEQKYQEQEQRKAEEREQMRKYKIENGDD